MMKTIDLSGAAEKIKSFIRKNVYVLLILLVGVFVLIMPTGESQEKILPAADSIETEEKFSLENTENRLREILESIDGAGKVMVRLAVKNRGETVMAADVSTDETGDGTLRKDSRILVITSDGSDEVVALDVIYPEITGAVITAEGAGKSQIKLDITEAVSAVTGLSFEKIKVFRMKNTGEE